MNNFLIKEGEGGGSNTKTHRVDACDRCSRLKTDWWAADLATSDAIKSGSFEINSMRLAHAAPLERQKGAAVPE